MYNKWISVFTFVAGAVVGASVSYLVLNKRFNKKINAEINEMREYYDNLCGADLDGDGDNVSSKGSSKIAQMPNLNANSGVKRFNLFKCAEITKDHPDYDDYKTMLDELGYTGDPEDAVKIVTKKDEESEEKSQDEEMESKEEKSKDEDTSESQEEETEDEEEKMFHTESEEREWRAKQRGIELNPHIRFLTKEEYLDLISDTVLVEWDAYELDLYRDGVLVDWDDEVYDEHAITKDEIEIIVEVGEHVYPNGENPLFYIENTKEKEYIQVMVHTCTDFHDPNEC